MTVQARSADDFVRLAEAAARAEVARATLHREATGGKLPFLELDTVRFFRVADVDAYREQRRREVEA